MLVSPSFYLPSTTSTPTPSTLSLHDALPISRSRRPAARLALRLHGERGAPRGHEAGDRKSTRLNSSHVAISYAVFCLKKKNPLSKLPPKLLPPNPGGLCVLRA